MAAIQSPQDLPDDLVLTQYGDRQDAGAGFRDRLRTEIGETELSLILGDVDEAAAAVLVTKWLSPWACVRKTTVGALKRAGFRVIRSPTKANRLHVSVYAPDGPAGPQDWDDELAKAFNACFTEVGTGEVTADESAANARQPGVGPSA